MKLSQVGKQDMEFTTDCPGEGGYDSVDAESPWMRSACCPAALRGRTHHYLFHRKSGWSRGKMCICRLNDLAPAGQAQHQRQDVQHPLTSRSALCHRFGCGAHQCPSQDE